VELAQSWSRKKLDGKLEVSSHDFSAILSKVEFKNEETFVDVIKSHVFHLLRRKRLTKIQL